MTKNAFTATKTSYFEALMPFSIALAILVFAFIPSSAKASTDYYVNIPNLGAYATGPVSYICNGGNCSMSNSTGNQGNAYGTGGNGYGTSNSQYPNYTYQYYKSPGPVAPNTTYGSNGSAYTPIKANYTPYPFSTYVQYVRQADGSYKLGQPKVIPTYAWNADNSLPLSATGGSYPNYNGSNSYAPYNSGYGNSNMGHGFTLTSQY